MKKQKEISVGISIFPPFTTKLNEKLYGFEVEFFEFIAKDLNLKISYKEESIENIIKGLQNNIFDVGLGGFSATERKEKMVDFSHGILSSNFGIVIKNNKIINYINLFKHFFSKSFLKNFIKISSIFLVFIFTFSNLLVLVEKNSTTFVGNYFEKIFHAFWFTVVTIATVGYGDVVPQTFFGKLISILIIFFGIGMFGFYISTINQMLNLNKFKYKINSYKDLKGKNVCTLENSSSYKMLQSINVKKIIPVKDLKHGFDLIKKEKVDAFVYDYLVLKSYIKEYENEKDVYLSENIFGARSYAFAINDKKQELKELINRSILKLKEDGTYNFLCKKWFREEFL